MRDYNRYEAAEEFLAELYAFREAVAVIERRYFDSRQALFPDQCEALAHVVECMEKLAGAFNDRFSIKGGQTEHIDLVAIRQNIGEAVSQQVSYLIDSAKAVTLSFRGEDLAALELMDKYQ